MDSVAKDAIGNRILLTSGCNINPRDGSFSGQSGKLSQVLGVPQYSAFRLSALNVCVRHSERRLDSDIRRVPVYISDKHHQICFAKTSHGISSLASVVGNLGKSYQFLTRQRRYDLVAHIVGDEAGVPTRRVSGMRPPEVSEVLFNFIETPIGAIKPFVYLRKMLVGFLVNRCLRLTKSGKRLENRVYPLQRFLPFRGNIFWRSHLNFDHFVERVKLIVTGTCQYPNDARTNHQFISRRPQEVRVAHRPASQFLHGHH